MMGIRRPAHVVKRIGILAMIKSLPRDFISNLDNFSTRAPKISYHRERISYILQFISQEYDDESKSIALIHLAKSICSYDDYDKTSIFLIENESLITNHPYGHKLFYVHFLYGLNELSRAADGSLAWEHRRLLIESIEFDCAQKRRSRVGALLLASLARWEYEMGGRVSKPIAACLLRLAEYEVSEGFLRSDEVSRIIGYELKLAKQTLSLEF
jgi:hypothetical protein